MEATFVFEKYMDRLRGDSVGAVEAGASALDGPHRPSPNNPHSAPRDQLRSTISVISVRGNSRPEPSKKELKQTKCTKPNTKDSKL